MNIPARPQTGADRRILVVEDENLIALFLEDTLDDLGYDCCGVVASADDAVEAAKAQSPDIALVDIGLKGERDGIDLARQLQEELGVGVVFLSGAGEGDTMDRARSVAPKAILAKPYTETELADLLEAVFESRSAE